MKLNRGFIFIVAGFLCIAVSIVWAGRNVWLDKSGGEAAHDTLEQLTALIPANDSSERAMDFLDSAPLSDALASLEIPDYLLDTEMEMPVYHVNGKDYIGYLCIPSLSIELPVGANWSYDFLQTSPCRYSGSAYRGNLVIAGHNYSTHFGNLHLLAEGDEITFTDVDGNLFTYAVERTETIGATAVDDVVNSGFDLTLFTCTIGGQYRICAFCTLTDAQPNLLQSEMPE